MKKQNPIKSTSKKLLLSSVLVSSLFAGEQNFIELGGGFSSGKDNFSTDSDKTISSYTSAKSKSEAMPNLSFYYGGELNNNTTLYSAMEFGSLVFGSEIETSFGMFDVGIKGDFLGEAWENPFVLNSERKKTDVQEVGGYIAYGLPLAQNYMAFLKYEFSEVDYDKDSVVSDLKRDGDRHIVSLENMIELNKSTSLVVTALYEKYKADGEASTYDNMGLEFGIQKELSKNLELKVMVDFGKKEFDKINPVLNKKIDSTKNGLMTSFRLLEPFGYENTYVSLNAGYEKEDANHDFYDKENRFGMLSIGYTF